MDTLIALVTFSAVFLMVFGIAVLSGFLKNPVDDRLERINRYRRPTGKDKDLVAPFNDPTMISTIGERFAPANSESTQEVRQRLSMAGCYGDRAYHTYWAVKIGLIATMPILVYGFAILWRISLTKAAFPAIFAIGIGMFIPDIFLYLIKRRRHEMIFCGLPDALDLLVVCIEAGLGLDAAMQKVSEEFHLSNRVLSDELNLTCSTIRMGQPRCDALHDLGERTGVLELKSLAAVLTQSDRFGTSMAQALRVHSDDMRTRRRQRAEEMAAKTTVKLIFPLVVFIFPSIFVVLGGPAVLRIMETFMKHT